MLAICVFVGSCWFFTETIFVYILQFFLASIGLIDVAKVTSFPWIPRTFAFSCFLLLGFAIMRFIAGTAKGYLAIWMQHGFVCHIRRQLFQSALKGDVSLSSHEVLSLFSEVTNNGGTLMYYLSILIVDVVAAAFFIVAGLYLAPFEIIVGSAVLLLMFFPFKRVSKKMEVLSRSIQSEWETVNYELSTSIKNKFLLKLYDTVDGEVARGNNALIRYFKHQKTFAFWFGFIGSLPLLMGIFAVVVVTSASAKFSSITPINLMAFFYIFMRLTQVAGEGSTVFSFVRLHVPALRTLYDWLYRKQPILSTVNAGIKVTKIKGISFENVNFAFGERLLFSNLNFTLEPGQTLAIVGASGTGKSTLLSVLLGLLPANGVRVNGLPINQIDPSWRERVAYVGPDPFAIEGTLRSNLLYGNKNSNVTDEQIWQALEAVGLKKEFGNLPDGLDFYLKSTSRFSSGQLQRLSIARALLRDFDILVFDEGTANLDSLNAQKVLAVARDVTKNKIFVRVTHQGVDRNLEQLIELQPLPRELNLSS